MDFHGSFPPGLLIGPAGVPLSALAEKNARRHEIKSVNLKVRELRDTQYISDLNMSDNYPTYNLHVKQTSNTM